MAPLEEVLPLKRNFDMPPPLSCPQTEIPVGGRLAHFAPKWQDVTNNKWALSIVEREIQDPVQGNTSSIKRPHFLPTNQKARIGRTGQQSPKKEGSGGNSSGISRKLLKNISCPKKEWKNEAHNRSFNSKQICSTTKLQNGNSEKSQKFNSSKQLGIFIGSDRRIFARLDTSFISQISLFCSEGQNLPIQSSTIWSVNEPICVHSSHENNSISSSKKSYHSLFLPR